MISIKVFVFSPFQVNTYLLYDETKEAIVVDPSCLEDSERAEFKEFVEQEGLKLTKIVNTHLHVDHVFGSHFVKETYGTEVLGHKADSFFLEGARNHALAFGITLRENPPSISQEIGHGEVISFGNSRIEVRHLPGHSPGGLVFYCADQKFVVVGDVLFRDSIGRTDLPMASHQELIEGIRKQLMTLDDDVVVYTGHGPSTTIGHEKSSNMFLV